MTAAAPLCSHPRVRPLLALPLLLCALPAAAAPESPLRLGFEGGVAWYNAFPDELVGPAGLLRLRTQITPRIVGNVALSHLRQPFSGGLQRSTLVPVTIDVRLDRAPVAPYVGGGVAGIYLEGAGLDFGAVFEAGVEWELTPTWALSAQATYTGHRQASVFPYFSSLTFGLSASLL